MKRTMMKLMCGLSIVAFASASPSASAQWTQWGGPNQDFRVDAKGLAAKWPEAGPKQLWKRDLGDGYSAILADGGRLYTMYRGENKEIVIALDAATGKTIWEHKYDSGPADGHVHEFGDGPRSTPLIIKDRLYTIGVSGTMHCLNKEDGKPYWKQELWKDEQFGGNKLNHGYSSSPVAYKNTVIALVGGKGSSIVAFDQMDGKVAWKAMDFANSYSTPKLITLDGEDQMVTFMAEEIIGFDPNNGNMKWRVAHGNQWKQNVCMPVWHPQSKTLVLSAPEAGAKGLTLTKNGDKTDVKEAWSSRKIQFYHVNSIGEGDFVYGTTGMQAPAFFAALNVKTGEVAWRERGFAKSTCLYADGKLIVLDEDGQLALASATPKGLTVESKTNILEKVTWTVPTLSGKSLFVRDKKAIVALDLG